MQVYLLYIFPLLMLWYLLYDSKKKNKKAIAHNHLRRELTVMTELVKDFIGKDCAIYTMNDQVCGIIESVDEKWLVLNDNGHKSIVNSEYIIRVKEIPHNKNGKRKALY